MLKKIILLNNLIKTSDLTSQSKLNTIFETLQKTEEIVKAKALSEKIISGDLSKLKEVTIENLIEAFTKISIKENCSNSTKMNVKAEDNQILDLKYEIKTTKLKLESLQFKSDKKINELEEKNRKLMSTLSLTNKSPFLKISYETYCC